jgi:endo-1,4-beta-xylanase
VAVALATVGASAAWRFVQPVLDPGKPGTFDETAVKDPSILRYAGRWHLFYTARGMNRYSLGYVAAKDLHELNRAPRHRIGPPDYAAAPQVFFFRPQKRWYLIYQTMASNYQPVFSTTTDLGQPGSWSAPQPLTSKLERDKWIDFWIICDDQLAWLFFTRNQTDVYAMTTSTAQFPSGFANPRKVFSGVHEAVHVYRTHSGYAMLFETSDAGGWRRFGLAKARDLGGQWRLEAPEYAAQIRGQWSRDISHGELLRSGYDERMEADVERARFLIQGMPEPLHRGDYPSLPWRLGLIRNY